MKEIYTSSNSEGDEQLPLRKEILPYQKVFSPVNELDLSYQSSLPDRNFQIPSDSSESQSPIESINYEESCIKSDAPQDSDLSIQRN